MMEKKQHLHGITNAMIKKIYYVFFIICNVVILSSCNKEDTLGDSSKVSYLYVNLLPSSNDIDSTLTRSIARGVSTITPYYGHGDSLGIFSEGGSQIPFEIPLAEGQYQSSVSISAEGWRTKDGELYAVYHPYNFYDHAGSRVYWDLRRIQEQPINDTPIDLGKYWMLASDTCSNTNNIFHTTMNMYNCVINMYCSVPNTNKYTKMVIATDDKVFPTYGYFDLFDISGSKTALPTTYQPFHALEYSNHVTLKFTTCSPTISKSGNWVSGYICLPDIDMKGRTLTCYLWDISGNCYVASKTLATTSNGNGAWKRNATITVNMTGFTLTTTPYTNLNPWEEDKDTCSTCYPVAF